MLRAHAILEAGRWEGPVCDTVVLDYDGRHRRRFLLTGQGGLSFLLDLSRVPSLEEGDALVLDDGRLVEVAAARESLLEIRASDARQLARLAWHLGNRHLPTQIDEDRLIIRADSVIEDMLRGLGAGVEPTSEVFRPEGGAWGHKHDPHGHEHQTELLDHESGGHHHQS